MIKMNIFVELAQFTGNPILLAVMADDSTTPEKDGFLSENP